MANKNQPRVLWFGVTPMIPLSERSNALVDLIGTHYMTYPNNTGGMGNYNNWKRLVSDYDVVATDQSQIDQSWENFFAPENWGKKIYKWENGKWEEVQPSFSK